MKYLKILPIVFLAILQSCETEDLTDTLTDGNASIDQTTLMTSVNLEVSVEEADDVLDDIAIYSSHFFGIQANDGFSRSREYDRRGRSGFFRECADIAVTQEGNTITTVITFTGECLDDNDNAITGTVTRIETYTENSSENSLAVENLTINGYVINGTKSFSWTSQNENGNPEKSGSVAITVETNEGTITKEGFRKVEITEGGETDTWVDNVKTITGNHTYITASGLSYSVEITTPLVKPAACKFIVSGVKTYTRPEGVATLDYGDGTCDGFATLTKADGTTEQVVLGKKRHHKNDDDDDDDNQNGEELSAERLAEILANCDLEIYEATGAAGEILNDIQGELYLTFDADGKVTLRKEVEESNDMVLDQGRWNIAIDGFVYLQLEMNEYPALSGAWKVGRKRDGYVKIFKGDEEYIKVEFECGEDREDDHSGQDDDDDSDDDSSDNDDSQSDDLQALVAQLSECPLQIREFVVGDSDFTSNYFEHEIILTSDGIVSLSVNDDSYELGTWSISETPNGKFISFQFDNRTEFNLTFLVNLSENGQVTLVSGTTELILQITC